MTGVTRSPVRWNDRSSLCPKWMTLKTGVFGRHFSVSLRIPFSTSLPTQYLVRKEVRRKKNKERERKKESSQKREKRKNEKVVRLEFHSVLSFGRGYKRNNFSVLTRPPVSNWKTRGEGLQRSPVKTRRRPIPS